MGAFCKVTCLACVLKDGDEVKRARARQKKSKKKVEPNLKSREVLMAVEETPSLFDFIAYMNFAGASISGPWLEYKDLMQLYRKEGHYENIDKVSTFVPGFIRFLQGWGCIAIGGLLSTYFNLNHLLTAEFAGYSLPY